MLNLWAIFIPLLYYLIPKENSSRLILLIITLVVVVLDFVRLHINGVKEGFILLFGSFLRRHELTKLNGATYLLLGCFITSLLFRRPIVIAVCSFIIIGDTFAALLGLTFKGPKIFKKSLIGSLGFLGADLIVAVVLYHLFSLPFLTLVIGALVATVIEALPLPWDDNFAVPIFTGIVMTLI